MSKYSKKFKLKVAKHYVSGQDGTPGTADKLLIYCEKSAVHKADRMTRRIKFAIKALTVELNPILSHST